MPSSYKQAGKVLQEDGKENMLASCAGLRNSTLTLIHCCNNSLVYVYIMCGTQAAANNVIR